MSRLLQGMGHEVFVANARKVRAITGSELKNDRNDAEKLALFAPHDVRLLSPIQHRSPERQRDLSLLQTRDTLVRARTMLVNAMRGLVKSTGQRLPKCSTESFADSDSGGMQPALTPMLEQVTSLTEQIRKMDKQIEALGNNIPKVVRLRSVPGVGPSGCSCVHVEAGLPRDSGKEPGGGRLPGIRAAAKPIRGVRSAATDQ
jgi:transposase